MKIDKEFKNLIPPLTQEERCGLRESIKINGIRDCITIWKEGDILLDGHNRVEILKELGMDLHEEDKNYESFSTKEHAFNWMIDNQLSRRNLSAKNVSYLRGLRYSGEKKSFGGTIGNSNAKKRGYENHNPVSSEPKLKTHEKIAKQCGVSPDTIVQDEKYVKAVNEVSNLTDDPQKTKQNILSGDVKVSKDRLKNIANMAKTSPGPAKKMFESIKSGKATNKDIPKPEPKKAKLEDLPENKGVKIVSEAVQIKSMIMSQLERISKDDPKRKEVFCTIIKWMEDNK